MQVDAHRLTKNGTKKVSGYWKNGAGEETAQKIWEMMLSFDGYLFYKRHSASYAMMTFQSAYLQVHYPACFMAAVLSNLGGYCLMPIL
jgi:DNA polymerase-3 subunit alpha/error-prone DNA polymerase